MNNFAPMKNCPGGGGVQGNLNWMPGYIQFYLLLGPYRCFISLLYLDLYVLGDDTLISQGFFMKTKYLCVLIHI